MIVQEELNNDTLEPKISWDKKVSDIYNSIIELELFLLRVILIAWIGWLAIKIFVPTMSEIHKIFEYATN